MYKRTHKVENPINQPFNKAFQISPKLEISQQGDKSEREANDVADRVMKIPGVEIIRMQPNEEEEELLQPKIQMKPVQENSEPMIRKQDEEEETSISPDATSEIPGMCSLNPVFPNFNCLLIHLKRNIDTNLYNNAHHFVRIASLYPDDGQMMEDAFMRYGLGVNILETSYQFLGADAGLATGLAYGAGIGLKAFDFFSNGELMLDYQIDLTDGINLDLRLDLNANPDDLTDIQGASAGVGVSGHF